MPTAEDISKGYVNRNLGEYLILVDQHMYPKVNSAVLTETTYITVTKIIIKHRIEWPIDYIALDVLGRTDLQRRWRYDGDKYPHIWKQLYPNGSNHRCIWKQILCRRRIDLKPHAYSHGGNCLWSSLVCFDWVTTSTGGNYIPVCHDIQTSHFSLCLQMVP